MENFKLHADVDFDNLIDGWVELADDVEIELPELFKL